MASAANRWQGRPGGAFLVSLVAVLLPVLAAVATAAVTSRLLPRPDNEIQTVLWWSTVIASSTLTLVVVDRQARRLLPLALLLKLALAFPDRAPSRLKVALRASTVGSLRKRLERQKRCGVDDEPSRAAAAILVLVGALSRHDRRTRGHSERVRAFTDLIAEEMQLSEHQRDRLRWSALLHDIGKVRVHPEVLNKDGDLTHEEWAALVHHPLEGAKMVEPLRRWLGEWADAIQQHHERWDGKGYPYGLSGTRISRAARIVAVADSFEVMTATRSYKRPLAAAAARNELAACAGAQFDPEVVRAFLNVSIGRLRWIMAPIAWLAELPFLRPATSGQVAESAGIGVAVKTAAAVSLAFLVGPAATPPPGSGSVVAVGTGGALVGNAGSLAPAEASVGAPGSVAAGSVSQAGPGAAARAGAGSSPGAGAGLPGGVPGSGSGGAGGGPGGGGTPDAKNGGGKATPPGLENKAPVTGNDRLSAAPGQWTNIFVLSNDHDPDGNLNVGSLVVFRPPSHGQANVVGSFVRYRSDPGFGGTDVFQYRICDHKGACSVGTVQVDVG